MQPVTRLDASDQPPFSGTWFDYGIRPALAEAVRTHKGPGKYLEQPSTIQREVMKAPKDQSVLGIAATGSGKAFAMLVPALDDMLSGRARSALVLAITNPLLDQHLQTVRPVLEAIGRLDGNQPTVSTTKANSKSVQTVLNMAQTGPVMVFSTPFQILEMSKKSREFARFVAGLDYVILDEVDAIVADPTFGREVASVLSAASRCRLIAVTATFTEAALEKIRAMSHQPVLHIVAGKVHDAVIQHDAYVVAAADLLPILATTLLNEMGPPGSSSKIMVFCATGKFVELCYLYCVSLGLRGASRMHPRLSDGDKNRALKEFHACKECVLFGSNVTARGMDFEGVTLVVQVGFVPADLYMQRAGRTGRGLVKTGRSILLLTEAEKITLDLIERARGVRFATTRPIPSGTMHARSVPQKVADEAYASMLGDKKGNLKTLRWTPDTMVADSGAIVQGAGFKVPALSDKLRRKLGL
jgi:ATP-dependent RNA helicase MSS116